MTSWSNNYCPTYFVHDQLILTGRRSPRSTLTRVNENFFFFFTSFTVKSVVLVELYCVIYPIVSEALYGSNVAAAMDSVTSRKSGLQPCVSGIPNHSTPAKAMNGIDFPPCKTELVRFQSRDASLPSTTSNPHLSFEVP